MAAKKKYYAVAVGKTRGIFTQWFGPSGAEKQVRGYPGAVYKGFPNLQEAEAFLERHPAKPTRHAAAAKPKRTASKASAARHAGSARQPDSKGRIVIYTDGAPSTIQDRVATVW
jgi:ribonuclease HI